MRILGVDYGDSRIGIAVSDLLGWTASGVETVVNTGNLTKVADRIAELARLQEADKIVVGFPRNMDGTIGPRAVKTQEFIETIKLRTKIDIIPWDERLSTKAANRIMHEVGMKTSKKKGKVDQIAAVYILQGYLDNLRNRNNINDSRE